MTYKVYKTFIKPKKDKHNINICSELCQYSKNLYNHCINIIHQWINQHNTYLITPQQATKLGLNLKPDKNGHINPVKIYSLTTLYHLVKTNPVFNITHNGYRLNTKALKQTLKSVEETWSGYKKALADYSLNKHKYKAMPKKPNQKSLSGQYKITFPSDAISVSKSGMITLGKSGLILVNHLGLKKYEIKEVEIQPLGYGYYVNVVHNKKENLKEYVLDKTKISGIDFGIKNVLTIVSNDATIQPLIFGTELKQTIRNYTYAIDLEKQKLYDKFGKDYPRKTNRLKRIISVLNRRMESCVHADTKRIVEYCLRYGISKVICGKNVDWKYKSNMGRMMNGRFQRLPYNKYIDKLTYKLGLYGIDFVLTEEAYTSKCSFMDNEDLCKHDVYMGKRAKRGLFIDSIGRKIQADVNGGLNIIRKVCGDVFSVERDVYCRLMAIRVKNNDRLLVG